jgi:hypothetical protein
MYITNKQKIMKLLARKNINRRNQMLQQQGMKKFRQPQDETQLGQKSQRMELQLKCKHGNLDGIHGRYNNATTPMVTSVNI